MKKLTTILLIFLAHFSSSQDLSGWYIMEYKSGSSYPFLLEKLEKDCESCYRFFRPERKNKDRRLSAWDIPSYERILTFNGSNTKLKFPGEVTLKVSEGTIYEGIINATKVEIAKLENIFDVELLPKNLVVKPNERLRAILKVTNNLDSQQKLRLSTEINTIKKSYFQIKDDRSSLRSRQYKSFSKKNTATITIPENDEISYELELMDGYLANFSKPQKFVLKIESVDNLEGFHLLTDTLTIDYEFNYEVQAEPYFSKEERAKIDSDTNLCYVDRINELSNDMRSSVASRFRRSLGTDSDFFFRNMERGIVNIDSSRVDPQLCAYFHGLIEYSLKRIKATEDKKSWLQNSALVKLIAPSLFSNRPSYYEDVETGETYRVGQAAAEVNSSIQNFGASYANQMAELSSRSYDELTLLMKKWTAEFNLYRFNNYDEEWNRIFDKLLKAILDESYTGNSYYDLEYLSPSKPLRLSGEGTYRIQKLALGLEEGGVTEWIEHAIFIKNDKRTIAVLENTKGPEKFVLLKAKLSADYISKYRGDFDPQTVKVKSSVAIYQDVVELEKTDDEEYYILFQRCYCPSGSIAIKTYPVEFSSTIDEKTQIPRDPKIEAFLLENPSKIDLSANRVSILKKGSIKKDLLLENELFEKNWEVTFSTNNKLSKVNSFSMQWDKRIPSGIFTLVGKEKVVFNSKIVHSVMSKPLHLRIQNKGSSKYLLRKIDDRLYIFENSEFVGNIVLSQFETNDGDIIVEANASIEAFELQALE